jgi:O-methyltransferase
MKLATLKISNSRFVAFIKSLCPPLFWRYLYNLIIVKDIPESYCYNPHYCPWLKKGFQQRVDEVHAFTGLTAEKLYVLEHFAKKTSDLDGSLAEMGVWKGGGAKFIADIYRKELKTKKLFYLFDSFKGMKEVNSAKDRHEIGDFSDTSYEQVERLLAGDNTHVSIIMKKGWIPETFAGLENESFTFVHVDLDLHDPIMDTLNFIYPRLARRGVIVFDDYGFASCPGARKAVDQFFSNTKENILVLSTGQAVIEKD